MTEVYLHFQQSFKGSVLVLALADVFESFKVVEAMSTSSSVPMGNFLMDKLKRKRNSSDINNYRKQWHWL